jgi:adenylate cyclase
MSIKTKNAELSEDKRLEFRIGINLGDVIEDADRIYGDGVNIAARIEGLAQPGGICISRTVYDQLKNKLDLGYEYLGEHTVKNIAEPVRVYRVLTEPEAAGKVIGENRFLGGISRRTAMSAIIGLIIVAVGLIGWNLFLQQSKKIEPASMDKMAYSELGEYKKARAHVDDALKFDANYSLKSVQRYHSQFKDPDHSERIINSLRKAGLPYQS